MKALFPVRVQCLNKESGGEIPESFCIGARSVAVSEILDRWTGRDQRYFKLQAEDGDIYILRHDLEHARWELTCFSRKDYLGAGLPKLKEAPVILGH